MEISMGTVYEGWNEPTVATLYEGLKTTLGEPEMRSSKRKVWTRGDQDYIYWRLKMTVLNHKRVQEVTKTTGDQLYKSKDEARLIVIFCMFF